jgi:threonine dehydrogenase-like Zn-dependent dehydrogenase
MICVCACSCDDDEQLAFPKLELSEQGRKCNHGVILKVVASNICGSDQHMVRGRTTATPGQTLGHEMCVACACVRACVLQCESDIAIYKQHG